MSLQELSEQIEAANRKLTQIEQNTAEQLMTTLAELEQPMLDSTFLATKTPQQRQEYVNHILEWALANVRGMLMAENSEEFALYRQGFEQALNYGPRPFSGVADKLEQVRAQRALSFLAEVIAVTTVDFAQHINESSYQQIYARVMQHINMHVEQFKKLDKKGLLEDKSLLKTFENLRNSIDSLLQENDATTFPKRKRDLEQTIKANPYYLSPNQTQLSAMTHLVQHQVDSLASTRLSYLARATSHKKRFLDMGWVALGLGLLVTGVVLAATVPLLLIPALVVGGIGMVYGAADFAKEGSEAILDEKLPELGERLDDKLLDKVQDFLAQHKPQLTAEEKQQRQQQQKKQKRLNMGIGLGLSGLGLALGVVEVLSLLPALAFPPVVPIVIAALAVTTVLATGAYFAAKHFRAWRKVQLAKQDRDVMANNFQSKLKETIETQAEPSTSEQVKSQLSSEAQAEKMLMGEGFSAEAVEALANQLQQKTHPLNDLLDENNLKPPVEQQNKLQDVLGAAEQESDTKAEGDAEGESGPHL